MAEEGASDGDTLFLTAGKESAFGADDCGERFTGGNWLVMMAVKRKESVKGEGEAGGRRTVMT